MSHPCIYGKRSGKHDKRTYVIRVSGLQKLDLVSKIAKSAGQNQQNEQKRTRPHLSSSSSSLIFPELS